MKFVEGFTLTLPEHLPPCMLSKRSLKMPLNELPLNYSATGTRFACVVPV